jgi:hypothetical protein
MGVINLVEAHESCEEANVRFCETVAQQVALLGQDAFHLWPQHEQHFQ